MDTSLLSILSFGVGAIGTYIGGSLALHGHRVAFVERPGVAASIRASGLHLKLLDREHFIEKPIVFDSLADALATGKYDAAIFAVKSFDTQAAVEPMRAYRDLLPPLLCLQNGVENESVLAGVLGQEKVIAGTVTSAVGRRDAGNIVLERLRGMGIAGGHRLSYTLVAAFNQAGLYARLYPQASSMKWSKMLTNLLANASSAILDLTPGEIYQHPGLYAMEVAQIREGLAVMRALDVPVTDLPGTPVRLLAWLLSTLPLRLSQPLLRQALGKGRGAKMPSFHIDLHSGRKQSEVEYLNGAVARLGAQVGIATPVNDFLTRTLTALSVGNLPLDFYKHNPEKFLADIPNQ